jgi:23S rRNA-/tRNA-specific pseudouridylate synthase
VRDGKEAQTYFEKIKDYEIDGYKVTSLFANPRTGRTHQIRVHLAAYGNPVLIDPIYMSLKEQELAELLGISRLMLHALSLKFKYNDKEYFFETKIPEEFKRFIN